MASTDARPIPRKNTAFRVTFGLYDADGDLVTAAGSLDSEVSKDGGAFADCTNEATEIATNSGMYYLDLTSTEMNADTVAVIVKSAGAKTLPLVFYPEEAGDVRVDVVQISGDATAADNAEAMFDGTGYAGGTAKLTVDVTKWNGTNVASPATAGYPAVTLKVGTGTGEVNLSSGKAPATIAAGDIANSAITAAAIATDAIDADAIADGAITSGVFAAGAITASAIAADAIGASELAADAVSEIQAAVAAGSVASVTGAVGSVTGNVGGNVVGSVGSIATGGISAASFAAGAIDAAAIAASAIGESELAAGAITTSEIATGAFDADALAADAVDEILDDVTEGSTTLRQAIRILMSFAAAKASGGGTSTVTFRDIGDTKDRITMTVNSSGDRTAVTLDGS